MKKAGLTTPQMNSGEVAHGEHRCLLDEVNGCLPTLRPPLQ